MFKLKLVTAIFVSFLPGVALADCDVAAGKKQYNKCAACHSMEEGVQLMGPSLHDLMGRKAGELEGFTYSLAMEETDFSWSEETLDAFLTNPSASVPGTTMPFGGMKNPEQRAALTCYIQSMQEQ